MESRRAVVASVTAVLWATFASDPATAQVSPLAELRAQVGVRHYSSLPDGGSFGEQLNLATGEFRLSQSDIVQATNGLPLALTRSFTPGSLAYGVRRAGAFGDWQLDLPRITTLTLRYPDGHGWRVAGDQPYARCSAFGAPPTASATGVQSRLPDMGISPIRPPDGGIVGGHGAALNPAALDPNVWWQGYQLVLPGESAQELLQRDVGNTSMPEMMGASGAPVRFPLVTAQQWQLSCLDHTDNGEPGEAFAAIAPDGKKYTFNHLIYRPAPTLELGDGNTLSRWYASLLVTKVEDRFGNTLDFRYDGDRLVSIQSGNEISVQLTYRTDVSDLVDKAILSSSNSDSRAWSYQYKDLGTGHESLAGVTRPDGTTWSYDLGELSQASLHYDNEQGTCTRVPAFDTKALFHGSITNPNGLKEEVTLGGVRHSRSVQDVMCTQSTQFPWVPNVYDNLALIGRAMSGPSVDRKSWAYDYKDAVSVNAVTEIVDPDGSLRHMEFARNADAMTEGFLQSEYVKGAGDGALSRSVSYAYAGMEPKPYPVMVGSAPRSRTNRYDYANNPLVKKTTTLGADAYVTEYTAFDGFVNPTGIRRSNSIAGQPSLETRSDYFNDQVHWVIGLLQSTSNVATGEAMEANTYDPGNGMLSNARRFGAIQGSYTYNAQGLLASSTDGNGLTTSFSDYALGIPRKVTYPDGSTETRTVNGFGDVLSEIDRAGTTRTYDYDAMSRITRMGMPQGDDTVWNDIKYTYELDTNPRWGLQGNHWRTNIQYGATTTLVYYDALHRPILRFLRDAGKDTSAYRAYDWKGRTTFVSYPVDGLVDISSMNQGVRTAYDILDRPVQSQQDSEQGVLTNTTSYPDGARAQFKDAKGNVTTIQYQVLDEPRSSDALSITAPEGVTQAIVRDVYGLPVSMTQSGLFENAPVSSTRQYVYDSNKRLCRIVEPETGSSVADYDAGGRLAWTAQGLNISGDGCGREQVADGARTKRSYDAMSRLTAVSYPAGTYGAQFGYDSLGRLISADTGLSRWTYGYNKLGLTISETLTVDGTPYTLSYAYDANGSLMRTAYPDGRTIDHVPDGWGRPTQAGSFANAARYLPNGELEYFKYGNGIEYFAEQNARRLPSNLSYALPGGGLLFSQDFQYDAKANLTQIRDLSDTADGTRQFSYDALSRLVHAALPSAANSETYSYDPLDNIRRVTSDAGLQRDYQYDPLNRLSSARGANGQAHQFVYDNRGNVTLRDSTAFTFDLANRLTEVSGRESYVYDAFGHRVLKTRLGVGGSKTSYVYSRAGQLLFQRDMDASSADTDYIYLGSHLVAQAISRRLDLPGAISFTPGSPTDGNYTIAWGKADGSVVYELQEQHDGGEWQPIYSGANTSFTYSAIDNQRAGGTYVYRLRACASSCGGWTMSGPMGVSPVKVSAFHFPAGVQKTDYVISWDPSYSATTYDVDEGETDRSGNLIWTRVATGLAQNSVQRPGNRVGTYQYRVAANNAYGTRGVAYPWNNDKVIVDPGESGPPSAPKITAPTTGTRSVRFPYSLRVAWDPVARATSYKVTTNWSFSCETGATECVFTAIQQGDYVINVAACNADGCSAQGNVFLTLVPMGGGIPTRVESAASTALNELPENKGAVEPKGSP